MPVGDAILDSPALDAGTDPVETQDAAETQVADAVDGAEASIAEIKGDERTVKASWRAIKATHPDIYNDLKNTYFAKQTLEGKLNGLNLDEMRPWLDENGGQQGINERLTELAGKSEELDGLYAAINSGDASIIDKIPEEQLAPIATAAFERFAQAQPEAWQAYQSNVFAQTINQAGILPFLDKMSMMLQYNDTQNLPGLIDQLKGWAQSFSQTTQQQPQRPGMQQQGKPAQKSVAEERKAWENERAMTEYSGNVATQAQTQRNEEIGKQLASFVDRRKGDTEAKDAAYDMLNAKVNARMTQDAGLQKQLAALAAKRDVQGALRLIASRESAVIREEAPKVGRAIFGQPAVAAAPKAEPKRETATQPQAFANPKKAFLNDVFAR